MVQLYNKELFVASALFFTSCTSKNLFVTSTKWKKWCCNPVNPDHADSVKLYFRQDVCYNEDGSMFFIFDKFKWVIAITLSWFNEISVSINYIMIINWQQATRISNTINNGTRFVDMKLPGAWNLRRFANFAWRKNCETNKKCL